MSDKDNGAVRWLLSPPEPAIRLLARRGLLGEDAAPSPDIMAGALVRALLSGQRPDGGIGVHPEDAPVPAR